MQGYCNMQVMRNMHGTEPAEQNLLILKSLNAAIVLVAVE